MNSGSDIIEGWHGYYNVLLALFCLPFTRRQQLYVFHHSVPSLYQDRHFQAFTVSQTSRLLKVLLRIQDIRTATLAARGLP